MNTEIVKEIRKIVAIIAAVVLLIVYSGNIIDAVGGIMDVFTPFFAGLAVAFVLNIPMAVIESKLMANWNGNVTGKIKRGVSMIASILIVIAVVFLIVFSLAPQLKDTIMDVGARIPGFYEDAVDFVKQMTKDYPQINEFVSEMGSKEQDWSKILNSAFSFVQSGTMGNIVSSTVNVASSIAVFMFKAIIAICFAIYLLVNKEKLLRNIKIVFETYLPDKVFKYIHHAMIVLSDNFKAFIAGQCLEAVVLGLIFAVVMAIFKIPYVLLISVLIAFTALIPVAGAFIGCFIGAFLILMVSPIKMIEFLILFIVIQQLENKLIYPRIVGSSIGLPAIWVFVAVTVGGSLSGVFGMLVFIPLASTMYELLKEDIMSRRNEKNRTAHNRNKNGNSTKRSRRKKNKAINKDDVNKANDKNGVNKSNDKNDINKANDKNNVENSVGAEDKVVNKNKKKSKKNNNSKNKGNKKNNSSYKES